MRFVRFVLASSWLLAPITPVVVGAQEATGPVCKDGTVSTRTGFTACWMHGGVEAPPPAADAAAKARKQPDTRTASSARSKAHPPATKAASRKAKSAGRVATGKSMAKHRRAAKPELSPRRTSKTRKRSEKPRTAQAHVAAPRHSKSHSAAKAPRGATARCMDGSYTDTSHRFRACHGHGGVAGWLNSKVPGE